MPEDNLETNSRDELTTEDQEGEQESLPNSYEVEGTEALFYLVAAMKATNDEIQEGIRGSIFKIDSIVGNLNRGEVTERKLQTLCDDTVLPGLKSSFQGISEASEQLFARMRNALDNSEIYEASTLFLEGTAELARMRDALKRLLDDASSSIASLRRRTDQFLEGYLGASMDPNHPIIETEREVRDLLSYCDMSFSQASRVEENVEEKLNSILKKNS